MKKVLVPPGNKDRILTLRYHLVYRETRSLMTMPTHRLPHNAGKASDDTGERPVLSALGGPFAAPLIAVLPAVDSSLGMR